MRESRDSVEIWLDASFMPEMEKVGILFHNRGHFSFEYDAAWLKGPNKFNIDPALQLFEGEQQALETFGIFTDSAPDRWGRVLMNRREVINAKTENRAPRGLREWDYLLGVQDITRMGSLRIKKDGVFLDNSDLGAPPITSLPELQEIARRLDREEDSDFPEIKAWLTTLIAPGSSLGGARPKANFRHNDGSLWIAKFPKEDDEDDIGLWEAITIELARRCDIRVPEYTFSIISGRHHTFSVKRFDRVEDRREMFVSAMTMLEKKDGESGSYLEIADFLQGNGTESSIQEDMKELWRRMVFNVMVSNRDDHLRNHGFMRNDQGWYLSPAYDINPSKAKDTHSINLNFESNEPTLDALFESYEFLRLSRDEAEEIVLNIHQNLQDWRTVARKFGANNVAIDGMASAFSMVSEPLELPQRPVSKRVRRS